MVYSSGLRSVSLLSAHPPNPVRRSVRLHAVAASYIRMGVASARPSGSSSLPLISTVISRVPSDSFTVTSGIGGLAARAESVPCGQDSAAVAVHPDVWRLLLGVHDFRLGRCRADTFDGFGLRVTVLAEPTGCVADVVPRSEEHTSEL